MKAAVWIQYGEIKIMEVPTPAPQKGQVLLKVHSAGICATDLHVMQGHFAYGHPPHILGHEIAGEIAALGPEVTHWAVGDRVVVETSVGCGGCSFCRLGQRHLCPDLTEIGFTPHPGGYAQYTCVPADNLFKLPDAVGYDEAGIMEAVVCPVGALYRLGVRFGETVLVFGVGAAGISFIQGAKALGAGRVIAVARDRENLLRAKRFGADEIINTGDGDVTDCVLRLTDGKGADLVCEAAGAKETVAWAVRSARKAGRVILYGLPDDRESIAFPVRDIILNQLEVHGAVGNPFVWEPLLQAMAAGTINVRDMITHRYPLAQLPQAFDDMRNKSVRVLKSVLHPWE